MPVISATAIAGVSALIRHSFGEKILRQAKQAVMLDIELLEGHECFIPQATMVDFLWEVERRSGEINFGLVVASEQSLSTYGLWGEYLLAAETLGGALGRAVSALRYHSRGDRMQVSVEAGIARVSFFNAMRGRPGCRLAAQRCEGAQAAVWLPSLRKGRGEREVMLGSLGSLYALGQPVRWTALWPAGVDRHAVLPTYPFQRERYWQEFADTAPARALAGRDGRLG